jgi:hypothetical protein
MADVKLTQETLLQRQKDSMLDEMDDQISATVKKRSTLLTCLAEHCVRNSEGSKRFA